MLRSHFEFAFVLHFIYINFVSSESLNDFCLNDLSCNYPLICSNSTECKCPTETFWNREQNTCLTCPKGWIEWQNKTCLLFVVVSNENIRNVCLSYSAELLKINQYQKYLAFQYKINELLTSNYTDKLNEYLDNGVWINFTDYTHSTRFYEWCDDNVNGSVPLYDCIRIMKQVSNDKFHTKLCLSHVKCNEKISYICEKSANFLNNTNDDNRFFSLIAGAVESLFFPAPKPIPTLPPPPPPTQPLIIYHTLPPIKEPLAQTSNSNNNTLYISIAVGAVVLISMIIICFCCCFGGGFLLFQNNNPSKPSRRSRFRRQRDRTSIDSTASDTTY